MPPVTIWQRHLAERAQPGLPGNRARRYPWGWSPARHEDTTRLSRRGKGSEWELVLTLQGIDLLSPDLFKLVRVGHRSPDQVQYKLPLVR